MEKHLNSIIEIEWTAQQLMRDFKKQGPLLTIVRKYTEKKPFNHLLVIQGSFDPPLLSHYELIVKSLSFYQNHHPQAQVSLLVLLSHSHVEKKTDVFTHSLLGFRVKMIERLLTLNQLNIPWMIGLSNSGRYIELTEAIKSFFPNQPIITYIMGLDVFEKLFQGVYYSKPLTDILPEIFETTYIVAGREKIVSREDFDSYLHSLPPESQKKIILDQNVIFLPLMTKFRYESSTNVRNKLSLNQDIHIPSLHPQTMELIQRFHLYSNDSSLLVVQIIIQVFIRLLNESNIELDKSTEIIQNFLGSIHENKENHLQIIDEYRRKENTYLKQRCFELLNDHTSKE